LRIRDKHRQSSYGGSEALSLALERLQLDEQGTFEGIASKFNTVIDAYVPTIIHPGAFQKTLQENGGRVRILWQHDPDKPIGKPLELREAPDGLFIKGKISATPQGQEALTLMRDGVVTDMSIGFDPVRFDFDQDEQGRVMTRHIRELALFEVSLVTMGANREARVSAVNSLQAAGLRCALEAALAAARAMEEHSLEPGELADLAERAAARLGALLPIAPRRADHVEDRGPQPGAGRPSANDDSSSDALDRHRRALENLIALEEASL
jgi:HK97 family phage prohead protease